MKVDIRRAVEAVLGIRNDAKGRGRTDQRQARCLEAWESVLLNRAFAEDSGKLVTGLADGGVVHVGAVCTA